MSAITNWIERDHLMETGMDIHPEPTRFPPLVERLFKEPLVLSALRELAVCERRAQRESDLLTEIPALPLTDRDVDVFLTARELVCLHLRNANVAQRKLAKAVRFYLELY